MNDSGNNGSCLYWKANVVSNYWARNSDKMCLFKLFVDEKATRLRVSGREYMWRGFYDCSVLTRVIIMVKYLLHFRYCSIYEAYLHQILGLLPTTIIPWHTMPNWEVIDANSEVLIQTMYNIIIKKQYQKTRGFIQKLINITM